MGTDSCIYEACAIDEETGEMDKTRCQQATISINVNDCPVDKPSSNEPTMVPPEVVSDRKDCINFISWTYLPNIASLSLLAHV